MAQRLVRTLCAHCRQPWHPKREDLPADFPFDRLDGRPLYRAAGCRECRHVGYRGRVGIFELLVASDRTRQLAHDRASTWAIHQAALEEGMTTLRDDGWRKVLAGRTTVEEVARVTKANTLRASTGS